MTKTQIKALPDTVETKEDIEPFYDHVKDKERELTILKKFGHALELMVESKEEIEKIKQIAL